MRLRLLDLDGSLPDQPALQRAGSAQVIGLRDLGDALRLWASPAALARFRERLDRAGPASGSGPEVTFMGSGDYHHLAAVLISRATAPLSVIHFDNHPDWVRLPPAWHCGSWVNRVLEMPGVACVVTVGPCSDDLAWPQFKGGNVAALKTGRLQIWPWRHAPSRMLGSPPLVWHNMGDDANWTERFSAILEDLPTLAVWVTIDKDVLAPENAVTNWDQGQMPFSALTQALRLVGHHRHIVGIDVCGEYSPARFPSPLKRLSAWLDHPRETTQPELWRNAATNSRLLEIFAEIAR